MQRVSERFASIWSRGPDDRETDLSSSPSRLWARVALAVFGGGVGEAESADPAAAPASEDEHDERPPAGEYGRRLQSTVGFWERAEPTVGRCVCDRRFVRTDSRYPTVRKLMSGTSQYLLALYIAGQERSGPVAPGDVAETVGRSPSATTEMLQRLAERGLVTHEPYEGASLTSEGQEAAEELYDTYTTLSQFFSQVLELEDYEEEAMQLAGNVSPVVADRLASTLPLDENSAPETDGSPR